MPQKKGTHTVSMTDDDIATKNIFTILGLANLPEKQKAHMLQKILQIIYQRAIARIMDALPRHVLQSLKRAIDAGDEKTATALLKKRGMISFPQLMAEEALFMKYELDALSKGDPLLQEQQ